MLLRDHPLMAYHGVRNWPPIWTWASGLENNRPKGEIGILTKVELSNILPADRCFLYVEHQGSLYIGCLLFDDRTFCGQVGTLLQNHRNKRISEIGGLDISHTVKAGRRPLKHGSRFLNSRDRFGGSTTEGRYRPAMPKEQPQEYPVTIEIEGKRYTGFYTVSAGVVTVESDWGELRGHVGATPERIARRLFLEILRGAKSRGELDENSA